MTISLADPQHKTVMQQNTIFIIITIKRMLNITGHNCHYIHDGK